MSNYDLIATALSKAQATIKAAELDASNPFFKSKYSSLNAVWEACRKPLTDNGLSVVQVTKEVEQGTKLVTMLLHESGQRIRSELYLRPKDNSPQAIGSALTYARRYTLASVVGISFAEDDDGEAATERKTTERKPKQQPANGNGKKLAVDPMTLYWTEVNRLNIDRSHAQDLVKELGPEKAIKELATVK